MGPSTTTRPEDTKSSSLSSSSSSSKSWFSFSYPSLSYPSLSYPSLSYPSFSYPSFSYPSFSWGSGKTGTTKPQPATGASSETPAKSSSWYFTDSINYAAEATYETMTGALSSLYTYKGDSDNHPAEMVGRTNSGASWSSDDSPPGWGSGGGHAAASHSPSLILSLQRQQVRRQRKRGRIVSRTGGGGLDSIASTIFQNPYQSVRGRHAPQHHNDSMTAIRSFISLVPDVDGRYDDAESSQGEFSNTNTTDWTIGGTDTADHAAAYYDSVHQGNDTAVVPNVFYSLGVSPTGPLETVHERKRSSSTKEGAPEISGGSGSEPPIVQPPPSKMDSNEPEPSPPPTLEGSWLSEHHHHTHHQHRADAAAETAAHLAEGTMRAWRDLALEEAVELNSALRFWSERWEQPGLSFLEAGPQVWLSERGYSHLLVGKRVAQIQAVLARRCAAIGELQQHLLQAGWQKGVAQWGVLGQGGHWATVAGFDGSIQPEFSVPQQQQQQPNHSVLPATHHEPTMASPTYLPSASPLTRQLSDQRILIPQVLSEAREPTSSIPDLPQAGSRVGGLGKRKEDLGQGRRRDGVADVYVRKRDGGGTFVDDPAFLARWSVDAIALVRRQLFRASNGTIPLPYASNWATDVNNQQQQQNVTMSETALDDEEDNIIIAPASSGLEPKKILPHWAIEAGQPRVVDIDDSQYNNNNQQKIVIADLPALTNEVSELLNTMEDIMAIQRERRLDRLQPPSFWRRNWYLLATSVPFAVWLVRHGRLRYLFSTLTVTVRKFFVERIQAPVIAIVNEVWKGRVSFSDKKARKESIEVLKKMIKSWLDDSYPDMPENERQRLANAMDVSLVEQKKAQSMESLGLNTFEVVRMSFIEAQWLKKEMMNALDAMDEVMSANDINMNIAAITPVFMIAYAQIRIIRYLFYAFLRLGTSQEETYSTFRAILLDIERLLVMRDNPPDARNPTSSQSFSPSVLGADDLGMLMLLIHECQTILWRDRRRFSASEIRSVSEDLAELAGERGAVSVKQQLLIVSRMTRSYPFLKVISTGHFFGSSHQLRKE